MQIRTHAIDRLVVGLDDSASDAGVLAWATREATARRCSLHVLATRSDNPTEFLDEAVDATLLIVGNPPSAGSRRRTSCPMVVVRGSPRDRLRRIVVGVDSSNPSAAALDWAMIEAAWHSATVTVVHAWQPDDGESTPSDVLIAESSSADLLVVGSRGPSGYRTLQFGSVALATATSAHCPVVVVHPHLITSGTRDPCAASEPGRS